MIKSPIFIKVNREEYSNYKTKEVGNIDFIVDTLFQIFFAFFWIVALLLLFIKTKKDKKNKGRFLVFLILSPLLMIWTLYSYNYVLEPRFQDIKYYINKDYQITTGKCSSLNDGGKGVTSSFVLDEETYYYNKRLNKIYKGKSYKLHYLPNSKYVIESESLE
ncbi:hypothetical protein [Clostridium algidicarnis]|uniref:hypothetical protein n=1 Tax=Clostridium algidicarnis TaxID=37659 RepID=UPI0016283151|nr:hypothetical protein [Clostridium algidicarnis]MBB6631856.1 hypothetical protein [Clostridium algidicarnis]